MKESPYTEKFFADTEEATANTATLFHNLLTKFFHPNSIVDVGCATGLFLSKFKNKEILGIDGRWVSTDALLISKDKFLIADLSRELPHITHKFDIALCLETAEHLPEKSADKLVAFLCGLSDKVIFSAAIPHQRGTDHLNEQWQTYWRKKFGSHEYHCVDCIRPALWNSKAATSYKQNTFLYTTHPQQFRKFEHPILDIVHPDYWEDRSNPKKIPIALILDVFPYLPKRLIRYAKSGKSVIE